MQQKLLSLDEVKALISGGKTLLLAGEESLLAQLPTGNWVGGTIPYFIAPDKGGLSAADQIFVTDITDVSASRKIMVYDKDSLGNVYNDGGSSGFSFIIIPATSETHTTFALNAPNYENFGSQPLVGWISGVHLDDLGKVTPKVCNGETGEMMTDKAVVMHVSLPADKTIDIGIINIFEQNQGDTITFLEDGFSCTDVLINGEKKNFAEYINANTLDTKLPLVADYYGALVNTSFQNVGDDGVVAFYAPVFKEVEYKQAQPVPEYARAFQKQLAENEIDASQISFSCNGILNYLFSELEGKTTGPFVGPITFGEIAYQLLNQTLVYLLVSDS